MAVMISELEGVPASYPATDAVTAPNGTEANAAAIWQRIESWIAYRWRSRSVVYVVEGPGEWSPRLTPFTASTVEIWQGDAWEATTPRPAPLGGYVFDGDGPYRVTGTAGDASTPPADVLEAYRRLARFTVDHEDSGLSPATMNVKDGDYDVGVVPGFAAKSLQLSGAADLLRRYRRLGA